MILRLILILNLLFGSVLISFSQTTTTTLVTGNPFCSASSNAISVTYTKTGVYLAGNVFTAQLSDATGSFAAPTAIGTLTSVNNGVIPSTIPAGTPVGNSYRIRVVSSTPIAVITNDNGVNLSVLNAPGNPVVFGSGAWNVYGYNGSAFNTYAGFYTENSLNFNTTTRFATNSTPSNSNAVGGLGYSGCTITGTLYSLAYKRTNIPCGIYTLDIPTQDDNSTLLINGTQVFQFNGSSSVHMSVWTGFIDPSMTVEVDLANTMGNGYISFNANNTAATVAPVATAATIAANQCTSFNANWNVINYATGYFLDIATDNAFTAILPGYNNLNVGNVLTYPITGLTLGTTYYYRVRANSSVCSQTTVSSNTISYTTFTLTPVTVTPSTPTICAGNSVTLTAANAVAASYLWSPSAGLSSTTGTSVVATPAGATSYTVTGTSAQGCVSSATATISIYAAPPGNPTVFGNGAWNVYGYNGSAFNTYAGFYTENNLNFNTTTRFVATPSIANGSSGLPYAGCTITGTSFSLAHKRTNIACGIYSLDITYQDDNSVILINGTQVFQFNGWNTSHIGAWVGFIDPSTTVEVDLINTAGPGSIAFNTTTSPASLPLALAATNAANQCTSFNANWSYFNASNYYLDVATDNAFTAILPGYNNLNVGNVLTYPITGLTLGSTYYYRIRAYSSACVLTSGSSNTISYTTFTPTPVTVTPSTPTICAGNSVTLTAANAVAASYLWSPSAGLSSTTGTSVVATPAGATSYTVTGTSAQGCVSSATATISIYAAPPGNPTVFGNGAWNVYGYNGSAFNTYAGFYTENNLNFNTTTRYLSGSTPSNANASSGLPYAGCTITGTLYSLAYKRTNIACGIYSLDIPTQDDNTKIIINGTSYPFNGAGTVHIGAWVGFIDPTTNLEVDVVNTGGPGYLSFNATTSPASLPLALAATNAANQCTSFNANWSYFNASNYYLDVATDNAFTAILPGYNNLNVGNVLTYPITGLTLGSTYYYRIRAYSSACVLTSGSSNTISYTTFTPTPVTVTPSTPTICAGNSVTLTAANAVAASYLWSPSAGLSSTTGTSVVATPAGATSYTVTGTSAQGCVSSATATISIYAAPPGNPTVFGNGAWNVYGYNGSAFNTYAGFYTENNLNFNTTTRYLSGSTPSNANASSGLPYAGCTITGTLYSLAYKRTNIACGIYSLDIPTQDDNTKIIINGTSYPFNGAGTVHIGAWVGFIDPTTNLEVDVVNTGGPGYLSFNATTSPASLPLALAATNAANQCTSFNANWSYFNASNYYLDVATDNAFTAILPGYNSLDVSSVLTYPVTGLTSGTTYYYRIKAYSSACALTSGYSNTISYTTTNVPSVVITNPAAVCAPATVNLKLGAVTVGSTGGLTYTYWTDALATSSLAFPNAVAVSNIYYIKGTSGAGCFVIQPVTATINSKPTVTTATTAVICSATATNISLVSSPVGSSFAWTIGAVSGALTGQSASSGTAIAQTLMSAAGGTVKYIVTPTLTGCAGAPYTIMVTVNPNSIITLTSTAGTDAQSLCISTAISSITYSVTGGGTGAGVTGLPAGVTGTYAGGVFTISGTPTLSGVFNYTVTTTGTCVQTIATGTITVNPNAVIALTSAAATTNQSLCISTAISSITYSVTGGGTGAGVTGLPAGVTGTYAAGVFTISGTPTASGVFNYTVTTTGTCIQTTATGTITVNPNAAIALTSAAGTDAQSLCISTAISSITYSVTGGGTGAGVTGLPVGVTGTYAAGGVFTISGTPTASGVFNYTVTTTGTCIQTTATGTITVNPNAAIALTSAAATTNQSLCISTAITSITYSVTGGGTGAGVTGLPAGVTGTYAGGVFTISGTPTASGVFNYTVTSTGICTQAVASGNINVNPRPTLVTNNPSAVCSPSTVDLTSPAITSGSTPGLVFTYWNNSTATSSLTSPNAVTTSGNYYIVGSNASSCSDTSLVVVTINLIPTVVTNNPAIACSPSTVDLTAPAVTAGSTAGLTFTYWKDAATTISLPSPNAVSSIGTYYIMGATAQGCKATASVYVNSLVPNSSANTSTWTGSTNTNWFDPTNWCGIVPNATQSAYIPGLGITNMPLISGATATSNNITLATGAILNIASNENLNIYGNWTNNGVFNTGIGSVSFVGSATDTVSGSGTNAFYNLVLNNSSAAGDALILKSPINVNNNLTLTNGVINSTTTNILTMNTGSNTSVGNSASYIDGPMNYVVASTGPISINFPLGSGSTIWDPASMNNLTQSTNAPQIYTGQLINNSALALGYGLDPNIYDVSNLRYWQFSSTANNTSSTQMTLYYNSYDQVSDYTKLTVGGTTSGGSYWNDLHGMATANIAGKITTSIPTTSFGDFVLANVLGGSSALPVALINFRTTVKDSNQVLIQWTTINEENNKYFTIEESRDGKTFHDIGYVNGAGNTANIHNYSFPDFAPLAGLSYYRLKQTDYNGHITYSAIISVTISETNNDQGFVILPNPTDIDHIYIRFAQPNADQWEFQFLDTYGRELGVLSTAVNNSIGDLQLKPFEQLASGIYILIATTRNRQYVEKLIIK